METKPLLLAEPATGAIVGGRYTLLRKLGQGSTGTVYEAEQREPARRVAIKVLHPHLLSKPQALARFQREAQALACLSHPYAVKLYEQGEEQGLRWLALEWLEGETLEASLTQAGSLPEVEVVSLLKALCEILEEAHEKGVLHRDIKPSNIFMVRLRNGSALAKLLDFGLSSLQGDEALTSSEAVSGTPRYMSPEQWDGLKHTDARSDIYSLGVVAYQCLSGGFPFEADSPLAWVKKLDKESPRALSLAMSGRPLSGGLSTLLMRCIDKEPSRRPQTTSALRRALEDLSQPAKPPPRRRSSLAWLGVPLSVGAYLLLQPSPTSTAHQTPSIAAPSTERPQDTATVEPPQDLMTPTQAPNLAAEPTSAKASSIATAPTSLAATKPAPTWHKTTYKAKTPAPPTSVAAESGRSAAAEPSRSVPDLLHGALQEPAQK